MQHLLWLFWSHLLQWLHAHTALPCILAQYPCIGHASTFPEVHDIKALYSHNRDAFSCRLLVHLLFRAHWRWWPGARVALEHPNLCTVARPDLSCRTFHTGKNKPPWTFNKCFHVWFKEAPQHAGFMGIVFVCTRAGFRVPLG